MFIIIHSVRMEELYNTTAIFDQNGYVTFLHDISTYSKENTDQLRVSQTKMQWMAGQEQARQTLYNLKCASHKHIKKRDNQQISNVNPP